MQDNTTLGARGREKNQGLCYQESKCKKALEQSAEWALVDGGKRGEGREERGRGRAQHAHASTQHAQVDTNNTEGRKNTREVNPKVVWRSPYTLQGLGSSTYFGRHLYNRVTGDSGLG